jgi:hypothetical protein
MNTTEFRRNHPNLLVEQRDEYWIAACMHCGRFLAASRTLRLVYVAERCHSCATREFSATAAKAPQRSPAA